MRLAGYPPAAPPVTGCPPFRVARVIVGAVVSPDMSSATPDPEPYGYEVPPGFGAPPPGGDSGDDPLVPPGYGGLAPWWDRLLATLRRSGRPLAWVVALTFALPQLAASVVSIAIGLGSRGFSAVPVTSLDDTRLSAGMLGYGLLVQVVVMFVNAIGWGAGIWAVTANAAGQPARVAAALRYGLARVGPMFGWYLLAYLLVTVGLVVLVLPGIYLLVACALFGLAVAYEPGRAAIGRSFVLVHRSFPQAVGRVLLLVLVVLGVAVVGGLVVNAFGLTIVAIPEGQDASVGFQLTADVVTAALSVPMYMLLLVGLLLTYTQLRVRREPVSTGALWAAVEPDAGGSPPGTTGHSPITEPKW